MKPQFGDFLSIWNMPWQRMLGVIDWASGGNACHHCAMVLPPPSWHSLDADKPFVFDAWQPRSRYMPWSEYAETMLGWATHWQYRRGRKPFKAKLLRHPSLNPIQLNRLHASAQAMLDIRYNMVVNWTYGGAAIHCSEYDARCSVAADLTRREDYLDRRGQWKKLDKATPFECEAAKLARGFQVVYEYDAENLSELVGG